MFRLPRLLLTLSFAGLICFGASHSNAALREFKLLFSNAQDVTNAWGQLQFGATPMRKIPDCRSD